MVQDLDDDAMFQHFPGTLSDTVRAGKLWTYMETHRLHESLWYGHELRNSHKHHTSILDHPLQDVWDREWKQFVQQARPLHLLTASCGFLDAEGTATEHAPAATHMQDEGTDDEMSCASDYGTLA